MWMVQKLILHLQHLVILGHLPWNSHLVCCKFATIYFDVIPIYIHDHLVRSVLTVFDHIRYPLVN